LKKKVEKTVYALNKCLEIGHVHIADNGVLNKIMGELEESRIRKLLPVLNTNSEESNLSIKITSYKTMQQNLTKNQINNTYSN
jgi:hypothetical protein